MAESLPPDFVARPREFEALIGHLLEEDRSAPTAITAALRGAGGYGKTFLARAVCHDPRIKAAFRDGVLWVTLGERPNVTAGAVTIHAALTGERPGFADEEDAGVALGELLDEGSYLLVIDDVWSPVHLRPFLRGGTGCVRLITTRDSATLPPDTRKVDVDAMRRTEAEELLSAGLPRNGREALGALARRLGEWPLLLGLVNGALRERVETAHQGVVDAIAYVNRALDHRGLTVFDAEDAEERQRAVAKTVGVSVDALSETQRRRYGELAVFPEDVDIPVSVLRRLWRATGGFDNFDTDELCGRLARLSLLSRYDAGAGFIRLHDVMRTYLIGQQGDRLPDLHRQLLGACRPSTGAGPADEGRAEWAAMPANEGYLWRYVPYHLAQAGEAEELRALMLDFDWLAAKLETTDPAALAADFGFAEQDESLERLRGAVRLSAHVLAADPRQLFSQLRGRLLEDNDADMQALLARATERAKGPRLDPLTGSLIPPGGPLIRILAGHNSSVTSVAVYDHGKRAVSASSDQTLNVWDLESGRELKSLKGHSDWVRAVAVTPDGKRAVSASSDKTLKVWDLESGRELKSLTGHSGGVRAVAVTPDGKRAVSASDDKTLKVWDLESGAVIAAFTADGAIYAVAVAPDGRTVVAGDALGQVHFLRLEGEGEGEEKDEG